MMPRTLRQLSTAAFLIGAVAFSSAQITSKNGLYTFRINLKPKQVLRYQSDVVTPMVSMKMPSVIKVLSVANGVAKIEFTNGPGLINGSAMQDEPVVEVAEIDMRGKPALSGSYMNSGVFGSFPSGPVKVGAQWKGEVPLGQGAMGAGMSNASATYTFLGVKQFGAIKVASIRVVVNATSGKDKTSPIQKIAGDGIVQVDTTDGMLRSSTVSLKLFMSSMAKPFDTKAVIKRI
ncbi:MAG: hypothetical protein SFX74_08310 [Fimbriimonadaceae bacterium]|nr:hypothetical protein [Fimbriimonadaceae bacterium]